MTIGYTTDTFTDSLEDIPRLSRTPETDMPQKGRNSSAFKALVGTALICTFFQLKFKTHPTVGSCCQDTFNTMDSEDAQCAMLEILVYLH